MPRRRVYISLDRPLTVDGVNSKYAGFSGETFGCLTSLRLGIESKACSLVRS
jgi:hypothetical protein